MKLMTAALIALFYATTSFAITNSAPALSNDWTNVVQITTYAPNSQGDTGPGYCNATLISKYAIITAAHCAKLAIISGFHKFNISVGQYKYVKRKQDGKIVRVGYEEKYYFEKNAHIEVPNSLSDKIAAHGEKTIISPNEDVALLWWDDETPELNNVAIAEVVSPLEHAAIIKNLTMANLTPVSINQFSNAGTDTKRMATLNDIKWKGYVYSKSQSRVEEGDSGAPLFALINGKYKIFGVVKGRASTVFGNWDAYPTINPHLCQFAKRLPSFIKFPDCN